MELALYTLRSVAYAIVEPSRAVVLVMVAVMFYMQNRKIAVVQKMIIGESLCSPLELTLSQVVLGILAGAVGSLILTSLGVMFYENSGIEILFMISILLMFYKPRFFCFSYSAAILGALSIILALVYGKNGQPSPIKVNITYLMTFVGVLHFIEGILVMLDGSKGSVPVFTNKEERILGGFALKRNWALPIAIFIIASSNSSGVTQVIDTPSWWPLINNNNIIKILATSVIGLMPYYGIVGYNSVTFSKSKTGKTFEAGMGILLYGMILTLLAQLCSFGVGFEILIVAFAPLGHEAMLRILRTIEEKRTPLFMSDNEGIMVLEVAPTSPACLAGIKSGDKIIEINENKITSEVEIYNAIKESYNNVALKIKDLNGQIVEKSLQPDKNKRIGVVLVPLMVKQDDMINFNKNKFQDVLDDLKHKD